MVLGPKIMTLISGANLVAAITQTLLVMPAPAAAPG